MADRRKFEEIVTDMRERGEDDLADELEQGYGKSTLRDQAGKVPELEKLLAEANAKAEKLEKAPVREKAFRDYGVDFESLRPAERQALELYDGEFEPEKIAEFVDHWELPTISSQDQGEQAEQPNAAAVVAAARSAPAGQAPRQQGQITSDQVSKWPADKWLRFKDEHPEAAEDILQGKTVSGIAFA